MTRIELAGLMLGLLAVSVAGGISWRLFRPHRGTHVDGLDPVPIPRLEYGSMILEEETRLRGDWQDAYVRELAPEVLDEEAWPDDRAEDSLPDRPLRDGVWPDSRGTVPQRIGSLDHRGRSQGDLPALPQDLRSADAAHGAALVGNPPEPDLISMMSDEDFFHMARFEFRRLEWMASEPLTLPAWTGRAA